MCKRYRCSQRFSFGLQTTADVVSRYHAQRRCPTLISASGKTGCNVWG